MCILSAHNFANAWFQFVLGKWGSWSLVHLPAGTYTRQWLCQPTCASCYYSFSISHRNEAFLILVGTFLHLLAWEMAFIIFCLKLLAYLLLIFLLLLNWVQRKAIRNTSLGTIKYNSSGAINLQIKHMVVSSVLYFSSLYVPVVEVGSSRSSMGLRAAWALVEEGEAGTGLAGAMDPLLLFQLFARLSLLWLLLNQNHLLSFAPHRPVKWREIKKQVSPVVWQRGLRNLQLPTPEFGTATQPRKRHSHSWSLSGRQV